MLFMWGPSSVIHQPLSPIFSSTGTRTQVVRVKAEYPNQLDYRGGVYKGKERLAALYRTAPLHFTQLYSQHSLNA